MKKENKSSYIIKSDNVITEEQFKLAQLQAENKALKAQLTTNTVITVNHNKTSQLQKQHENLQDLFNYFTNNNFDNDIIAHLDNVLFDVMKVNNVRNIVTFAYKRLLNNDNDNTTIKSVITSHLIVFYAFKLQIKSLNEETITRKNSDKKISLLSYCNKRFVETRDVRRAVDNQER